MRVTLAVRELVDARGWDVAEFARRAGLEEATARGAYEGESTELDLAAQGRIAEALGVLPNAILGSVEEPQPSATDAPAPRTLPAPEEREAPDDAPDARLRGGHRAP